MMISRIIVYGDNEGDIWIRKFHTQNDPGMSNEQQLFNDLRPIGLDKHEFEPIDRDAYLTRYGHDSAFLHALAHCCGIEFRLAERLGPEFRKRLSLSGTTVTPVGVIHLGDGIQLSANRSDPDFFDLLRQLSETIDSLKEYLRGINDPEALDPKLNNVLHYLKAFDGFLDVDGDHPPDEVPNEITQGLLARLREINWIKASTRANQLVQDTIKLIESLSKWGS